MKCPYCGVTGESAVIDTTTEARGTVRRRRACHNCNRRYSTVERPLVATPLIAKTSGERQEFDRDKLMRGIRVSFGKRPVAITDIERLVDKVETFLQSLGQDEVPSTTVGDMVVQELKKLDPVAYLRYAIVYMGLDDLASVRLEIDKLLDENLTLGSDKTIQ